MPILSVTIHTEPGAPEKPALQAPCNGCGVCCLLEPCPLGVLLSGRRTGACRALRWHSETMFYRCGAITEPQAVLHEQIPNRLQWLVLPAAWLLQRWARRLIAAGVGCDCDVTVKGAGLDTSC